MPIRSYRVNFRNRGTIDPSVWNSFWNNLSYDLNDIIGSGVEPMSGEDLGVPAFLDLYDIAVSGIAGREFNAD